MSLADIEKMAKDFSEARTTLKERVMDLEEQTHLLKKKFLPLIKYAVDAAKRRQELLKALIEENSILFQKPRTMTIHGIKVGFQKAKGKIEWEDDEVVLKLIKKHFADRLDLLVKTKETPIKTAISHLEVSELKKLGIEVNETGDEIVVKPTDSDVDKLVTALLKEDSKEVEEAV
jgi:hypothetical protein